MKNERELLQGIRALDPAALGAVFDMYYPRLYRYIYQHLRHQTTAEDLAAEVFTRLLEQLAEGRGPRQYLKAWLYRVAHNLVVDEARRRVYRDHEALEEWRAEGQHDVAAEVQQSMSWQRARFALGELTSQQRAVIVLKFLEGWSNKDVARVLDTTEGAVKSLQHRGLAAMRRALESAGVRQEELL